MKENVLDVLMYLFENYYYDEPEDTPDREFLVNSLEEAGFTSGEISKAFHWLDELAEQRYSAELEEYGQQPIRVYSSAEVERLDTDSRGFIMYLNNAGILNTHCRELVIDRLLALESDEVTLDDVKWVVLMVLFNKPGQEANYAWMEELMFDSSEEYRH